jgi:hypothetical protein
MILIAVLNASSVVEQRKDVSQPSEAIKQLLLGQEKQVWEAIKHKDKAADSKLLADDFVGLYETGFGSKAEHVGQMSASFELLSYDIDQVRWMQISPDAVLLLYRARCQATGVWASACVKPQYISSLWVKRGTKWLNLFSQDTTATSAD